MPIDLLVVVGIRGSVLALNRQSGEIVWKTRLRGADFVNVLLDRDRIHASTCGEVVCLGATAGRLPWHNRLKGLGTGLTTLAVHDGLRPGVAAALAEKRRRDESDSAAMGSSGATA